MPVTSEPTQADARLGRAGELAAYLRDNPRGVRRDPEDLGREFGVDPAVVTQLQIAAAVAARQRTAQTDWGAVFKRGMLVAGRILTRVPSRPFVFQTVAGLVTLGLLFAPGVPTAWAVWVWIVAEAWCVLVQPRFRIVGFGSLVVWIVAAAGSVPVFRSAKPADVAEVGGPLTIGFLMGMGMALMNLLLGGLMFLVSGWIRIVSERRQEASRSRQDLLSRMFVLQERLASIPPADKKQPHPAVLFARSHLFLCAAVAMFVLASLGDVATIAFHVDPRAVEETQRTVATNASGTVRVATPGVGGAYLFIEGLLGLVKLLAELGIAILATTRRRLWLGCLGVAVGEAAAKVWAWPLGAEGSTPAILAPVVVSAAVLDDCLLILIARFGIGFNRILNRYRGGDAMDEATIVSELLEIRHRLSAISVQVYVLVVDAAGSTQMKRGADPLTVEYTFGRYQAWIGETVSSCGGKVDMRTGDGAICAFGDSAHALEAARKLQSGIGAFNAKVNRLELPFRLRIALHAGRVVAELDKVQFTEVIDVASHVEKFSPVGGIAMTQTFMSAAMTAELAIPPDLSPAATVDGLQVFSLPAG